MPRILKRFRHNAVAYRPGKGQEQDVFKLPEELVISLEDRGFITGYVSEGEEESDVGFSRVLIRDLRTRLAQVDDPEEIRRLRTLETRSTAIQHYDTRLKELEEE